MAFKMMAGDPLRLKNTREKNKEKGIWYCIMSLYFQFLQEIAVFPVILTAMEQMCCLGTPPGLVTV